MIAPDDEAFLAGLLDASVPSADPGKVLARHLTGKPGDRLGRGSRMR